MDSCVIDQSIYSNFIIAISRWFEISSWYKKIVKTRILSKNSRLESKKIYYKHKIFRDRKMPLKIMLFFRRFSYILSLPFSFNNFWLWFDQKKFEYIITRVSRLNSQTFTVCLPHHIYSQDLIKISLLCNFFNFYHDNIYFRYSIHWPLIHCNLSWSIDEYNFVLLSCRWQHNYEGTTFLHEWFW